MRFIAHRGNLAGSVPEMENRIVYIQHALDEGFEVEVDVWWHDGFWLGHDYAQYPVSLPFLENKKLWCHAKNLEALSLLTQLGIHSFWHQNDVATLTTEKYIWTYPGVNALTPKSIAVMPEKHEDMPLYNPERSLIWNCAGICSDKILYFKEKYKERG